MPTITYRTMPRRELLPSRTAFTFGEALLVLVAPRGYSAVHIWW
jgi:hypothetical protein